MNTATKARAAAMAVAIGTMTLTACSTDSYDEGTGKYSLIRADFVELHTAADRTVDYVLTDDGETLVPTEAKTAEWMAKADTLYRAVLYYNLYDGNRAKVVSLTSVPVLRPKAAEEFDEVHTDPVKFESLWLSNSGKFINIAFYMNNGQTDEGSEVHTIGLIDEGTTDNPDGTRTVSLRLYHDQGGMPEYYSSKYYISIPCPEIDADSAAITISTYDDLIERRVKVKR